MLPYGIIEVVLVCTADGSYSWTGGTSVSHKYMIMFCFHAHDCSLYMIMCDMHSHLISWFHIYNLKKSDVEWLHISSYVLIDLMRLYHVSISYSWSCLIILIGSLQSCWIVNLVFDEMAAHWNQLWAEGMISLLHILGLRLMFTIHVCYCSKINVLIGCHVCRDFIVFCLSRFMIIGNPVPPFFGLLGSSFTYWFWLAVGNC